MIHEQGGLSLSRSHVQRLWANLYIFYPQDADCCGVNICSTTSSGPRSLKPRTISNSKYGGRSRGSSKGGGSTAGYRSDICDPRITRMATLENVVAPSFSAAELGPRSHSRPPFPWQIPHRTAARANDHRELGGTAVNTIPDLWREWTVGCGGQLCPERALGLTLAPGSSSTLGIR